MSLCRKPVDLIEYLFDYKGRVARADYVLFVICVWIVAIFSVRFLQPAPMMAVNLLLVVPGFLMALRRWHDFNWSGWWVLLHIIPGVNFVALGIEFFVPGTVGPNRFGLDPNFRKAGAKPARPSPAMMAAARPMPMPEARPVVAPRPAMPVAKKPSPKPAAKAKAKTKPKPAAKKKPGKKK
jgi:uncharacterized membrane protein YhaH (DUF805 family)